MTKHEKMMERIEAHGAALNAIFPNAEKHGVELCKSLLRLENKARQLATDYCNGTNGITTDNWERESEKVLSKVRKLLGIDTRKAREIGLFLNGDARGYALKLSDDWTSGYRSKGGRIHTDMGGFAILAPDLTND